MPEEILFYTENVNPTNEIEIEDRSVSLCQVYVQYDPSNMFNDRVLLSLLATLKMHDFQIGQPVWGPADRLFYLCEHRLKTGLNQTILDKELNTILQKNGVTSKHYTWSCA